MDTVTEAYLAFAIMTLVGIGFPVGAFIASYFLRPTEDPNNRSINPSNQNRSFRPYDLR